MGYIFTFFVALFVDVGDRRECYLEAREEYDGETEEMQNRIRNNLFLFKRELNGQNLIRFLNKFCNHDVQWTPGSCSLTSDSAICFWINPNTLELYEQELLSENVKAKVITQDSCESLFESKAYADYKAWISRRYLLPQIFRKFGLDPQFMNDFIMKYLHE